MLALCFPIFSQSVHKDTLAIGEVVVTATRTSVNRNNVPLTVTVVSNETIERSSESELLPVLSGQVPGLFVTERGITGFGVSTGAAGQISIRGVGGNPNTQILVLLNGNPQFMGIMGHPLSDAYVASDVEKVEVIRGPASTLYGTNAMGGVINIITKEPMEDGYRLNARMMYGSYNTGKLMVNGGVKKGKFSAFASFNHDHTNGHRDSSDFTINNGYVKVGYEAGPHMKLTADLSLANFDATDPGMEGSPAGYTIDITRGMGALALNNRYDNTSGSFRFFYNFGEHAITDGFHSRDNNYGVVVYQSFNPFKGNTFTLGIDYKSYGGIAENTKAMGGEGMVFGDTSIHELAGYGYIQQELFGKLTLNAGFRLEHNSVSGYEPVPTVGLAFRVTGSTTLKASVAKGFRNPTIRELYLFDIANPGLTAERMVNYEAGIVQSMLKNRLSLEITGFKADGDNQILLVAGTNGLHYRNSGSFSNTGLEVGLNFHPTSSLSGSVSYSFIHMDNPVIATPEHQLFLSGTWLWKKFSFNMSVQHVNGLYARLSPQPETETYTLLHAKVSMAVYKYIDVFVKGENLTNQEYSINYGYPMPGIIAFGGVGFHLH
jgi:iron complex outermembrane receptor protein